MQISDLKNALFIPGVVLVLSVPVHAATQSFASGRQDIEIYHAWSGGFPVAQLVLLPEDQRENAVGYIGNPVIFAVDWKAFTPDEAVPEVDFDHNLFLFSRNTGFHNRISIGRVVVIDGIAEIMAMETMSAMPIDDKVGMSLAVVPRKGIQGIRAGDDIINLPNK